MHLNGRHVANMTMLRVRSPTALPTGGPNGVPSFEPIASLCSSSSSMPIESPLQLYRQVQPTTVVAICRAISGTQSSKPFGQPPWTSTAFPSLHPSSFPTTNPSSPSGSPTSCPSETLLRKPSDEPSSVQSLESSSVPALLHSEFPGTASTLGHSSEPSAVTGSICPP